MPSRDKTTSEVVFENYFNEKLTSSYQFMSGIAENAESILKQEMMINAIEDVSLNYAASKAAIQQRAWYLTTGELASGFLIGLKVVMDCLAYGGFIFIAIMVMLPTGINILGKYLQILIWLQLWAPLYAILNMVMSTVAQYKTQGIIGNDGLSMMTSVGLTTLQGNIEAIAAFCTSSIPFISYSLMQGGVGSFMHLAGTMTSGISGAASAASNEVSSGNLALNSVSYGGRAMMNVAGFKHDMGLSYKSGRMDMERFDGSQGFMTGAGRSGVIAGEGMNMSRLPDKMSISRAIDSGFSSSISKERSAAANFSEQYEEAKAMSVNNSKGLLESMSRNVGQSRGWQVSESSRYADSINKTAQFTKSLQEDKGYSAKQAAEISLSLGGKIFGFGAGSNFSSHGSYDEAVKEGKSLAESQGVTKHLEVGTSHLKDVRYNEGSGEDKKLTENLETSLNQMERYSNMANIHNAIADRISDQKQTAERLGIGVNEDITEQFVDYVANRKMVNGEVYGRDKAIQVLADPDKTADKGILVQEFANKVSSDLIPGFRKSDIINNMDAGYKAEHKEKESEIKQEVMDKVLGDDEKKKLPQYGVFNQEQGNIKQGVHPTPGKSVYDNAGKDLITNSKIAEKNSLGINEKLDSDKVKNSYQLYTPEGGDKNNKVNIVDNTRSEIQNVGDKVTQQQNAIDNQKVKLQDNYKEEANTSRIQKATDAVDGVIEKAVEGVGIEYTTRKEAKDLPPFKVDQAPLVTMSKEERVEAVKSSVSQSFLETQGLKFPNPQQEAGTTIPYNSNKESANESSSILKNPDSNQKSTNIEQQLGSTNQINTNQDNRDITPVKNQDNTKQGSPITVDSDGFVNLARPKQSVGPKTFAEEKKDEEEKLQNGNSINEAVNLKRPQSEGFTNDHLTNIKPPSKESQSYDSAQSNLSTENSYKDVDRRLHNTEQQSNITNYPVNNEKPVQSINQEAITGAIKHDSKVISNQQPLVSNITSNIGNTTNDKQLPQTVRQQESEILQSNTAGSSKEVSAINEGFVESTNKIKSQQSSSSAEGNNIPPQNTEKSWIEEEFDKPKPQVIKKTVNKGSTTTDEGMKKDLGAMKKLTENN